MLTAFLLLAGESYLAAYTLSSFELSQGLFGPTELRLLLIAGNIALLRNPWAHILGHSVLLFDLGGAIGTLGMLVTGALAGHVGSALGRTWVRRMAGGAILTFGVMGACAVALVVSLLR